MCLESPKLDFETYEGLARAVTPVLQELSEPLRKEALQLFRRLDDKMEALLVMREEGLLPTFSKS